MPPIIYRLLIVIAMAGSVCAQRAAEPPDFEVASVRLHTVADTEPSTTVFPGGRLSAVNLNVRKMLRNAFGIEDYQISGAPHWIDSTNYDIEARMPAGVGITRNDIPALLLSLLRTRFQLRYHRETAELTEYALEVSRDSLLPRPNTGNDETFSNTTSRSGIVALKAGKIPMDDLAYALRRQLGRPVTDKTGLSGEFDFDLTWSTEEARDSTVPSLFTVLQKIGLRLVSMKGPVEIVVIDEIERASDN